MPKSHGDELLPNPQVCGHGWFLDECPVCGGVEREYSPSSCGTRYICDECGSDCEVLTDPESWEPRQGPCTNRGCPCGRKTQAERDAADREYLAFLASLPF